MKYLSNYTEDLTTQALDNAGAFFAFSGKQFAEGKKEGVKYASCGQGLLCPVDNADTLRLEINSIHDKGVKLDIAENGIEKVIVRELYNHEAFWVGDIEDTVDSLGAYNVTREQILAEYRKELPNVEF